LRHSAVLTKVSEEFAPHYLAEIRHDMRQTTNQAKLHGKGGTMKRYFIYFCLLTGVLFITFAFAMAPITLQCTHPSYQFPVPGGRFSLQAATMYFEIPNSQEEWEINDKIFRRKGVLEKGPILEIVILRDTGIMQMTFNSKYIVNGTCTKVNKLPQPLR
jgi:hypothetical protein